MVALSQLSRQVEVRGGEKKPQLADLRETINAAAADAVVSATPCDLEKLIELKAPVIRARFDFAEAGEPGLGGVIAAFLRKRKLD